jgi:DNA replication protein DnaC
VSNTLNRHQELKAILDRLKLVGMSQQFADLALRATKEGLSHEAYLHELAKYEEALRQERRTERLLRQSGLPLEKTFRTFDLSRLSPTLQLQIERLKPGTFLESATNVIAVGKPGVGKSHVGAALGAELCLCGHTVFWTPTSTLVQRLLAAKRDLRVER